MFRLTRFNIALATLLSWVYGAVFVLTLYEVFMRYFVGAPTIWSLEMSLMLVAVGYATAGLLPTAEGGHLRIDILYRRFPAGIRRLCDALSSLIGVSYLAAVTWAGGSQAWTAIQMGERSGSAWNSWLPVVQKSIIPLAAFLMMVQLIVLMLGRGDDAVSSEMKRDS